MINNIAKRPRLLVFAKAPVPGQVKTRLQPDYTDVQAALIHKALVEYCLQTASQQSFLDVELWVAGEHTWWHELNNKYPGKILQQQGHNLGERMLHAATQALSDTDNVIIIGTDCPLITVDYLQQALRHLKSDTDVVLGPAEDGGYVLIGLNKVYAALFDNIYWGSDQVLLQTRDRLQSLSLSYKEINTLRDIDRAEDIVFINKVLPEVLATLAL